MSGKIVTFVSQHKAGSSARKAILMVFAESANHEGKGIWKSHKTIAELTEVSPRTVTRLVGDMVAEGLISHVGWHTTSGISTKQYDLNLQAISELPHYREDDGFTAIKYEKGERTFCLGGDTDGKKSVVSVTQTVREPSFNKNPPPPTLTQESNRGGGKDIFIDFWDKYPRVFKMDKGKAIAEWKLLRLSEKQHAIYAIDGLAKDMKKMQGGGYMPFVYLRDKIFERVPKPIPKPSAIAPEEDTPRRELYDFIIARYGEAIWVSWFGNCEIGEDKTVYPHSKLNETRLGASYGPALKSQGWMIGPIRERKFGT